MTATSESNPARNTGRLVLVALIALGLVVRLTPMFAHDGGWKASRADSAAYLDYGLSLAAGHGFQRPALDAAPADRAEVTPGYPLVVAAAEWTGHGPRALIAIQAAASVAAMILAFLMARRLGGLWAGVVAVALLVFDPLQVIFCTAVLPQVLVGLVLAGAAAAGLKFIETFEGVVAHPPSGVPNGQTPAQPRAAVPHKAWAWAAAAGALVAIAMYMDWPVGVLALGVGLIALVAALAKRRRRLLVGWAIGAAVLALALAPWLARNAAVVGRPVLATDLGGRLLGGMGPFSPEQAADVEQMAKEEVPAGEVAADDLYFRMATHEISVRPGAWLAKMAGNMAAVWSPTAPPGTWFALPPMAGYTSLLPVAVLALAGVWAMRRRRAALLWLLAAPAAITLVAGPFGGGSLERIAVTPILAVLGGVGLMAFADLGRGGAASSAAGQRPAAPEGTESA